MKRFLPSLTKAAISSNKLLIVLASNNKRPHRVGNLLQKTLGSLLSQKVNGLDLGFITVTQVRPADDLRSALVFVSIFGEEDQVKQNFDLLQQQQFFLRKRLAELLQLRFTPQLHFRLDNTLNKMHRLERLLEQSRHQGVDDESLALKSSTKTSTV